MKYLVMALVLALLPETAAAQTKPRKASRSAQKRARKAGKPNRGRKAPKIPKRKRPVEK